MRVEKGFSFCPYQSCNQNQSTSTSQATGSAANAMKTDNPQHQAMLEEHRQAKAERRERHKRNGGRKFIYPGHLF